MNKDSILAKLKQLKPKLQEEYSVKEIGLFGSFMNQSFTPESDIDLLVEFKNPVGWKFFSLELYLEKEFGRKVDLVTKNALKEQIKDQILKEVEYIL